MDKRLDDLKNDSFQVVPNGEKFANERIYVMLPYDEKNDTYRDPYTKDFFYMMEKI
jgi:hypothetical protein